MEETNVVKYENVTNEAYNIITFNNKRNLEYMLVHDFDNEFGKNYLVIGKFTKDITTISKDGAVYREIIKKVISKYKDDKQELFKCNSDKYYEATIIQNFLFTKEGYDLVTHKFLFTNGEILRTIKIDQQDFDNTKYYANAYHYVNSNVDDVFMPFDYYEKYYTLRQEEFQNLDINNIFAYTRANFAKIKNVIEMSSVLNPEFREINGSANDLETLGIMIGTIEAINTLREKRKNIKK